MNKQEEQYRAIGSAFAGAAESQLFGKPCFKTGGKAFVCFFRESMVFKLTGDIHSRATALPGATLFDPSGKGRPMKEWVQVPFAHKEHWPDLAEAAFQYVSSGS